LSKVLGLFKKVILGVNITQYLVKSYFISISITALFIYMEVTKYSGADVNVIAEVSSRTTPSIGAILYCLLACVLFPFATIVWDDLITTITSGNILILPLPFMLIWKIFKVLVLYGFGPFVAPIGMIYIYFGNGYHRR
jgi:hypothetical protein